MSTVGFIKRVKTGSARRKRTSCWLTSSLETSGSLTLRSYRTSKSINQMFLKGLRVNMIAAVNMEGHQYLTLTLITRPIMLKGSFEFLLRSVSQWEIDFSLLNHDFNALFLFKRTYNEVKNHYYTIMRKIIVLIKLGVFTPSQGKLKEL